MSCGSSLLCLFVSGSVLAVRCAPTLPALPPRLPFRATPMWCGALTWRGLDVISMLYNVALTRALQGYFYTNATDRGGGYFLPPPLQNSGTTRRIYKT